MYNQALKPYHANLKSRVGKPIIVIKLPPPMMATNQTAQISTPDQAKELIKLIKAIRQGNSVTIPESWCKKAEDYCMDDLGDILSNKVHLVESYLYDIIKENKSQDPKIQAIHKDLKTHTHTYIYTNSVFSLQNAGEKLKYRNNQIVCYFGVTQRPNQLPLVYLTNSTVITQLNKEIENDQSIICIEHNQYSYKDKKELEYALPEFTICNELVAASIYKLTTKNLDGLTTLPTNQQNTPIAALLLEESKYLDQAKSHLGIPPTGYLAVISYANPSQPPQIIVGTLNKLYTHINNYVCQISNMQELPKYTTNATLCEHFQDFGRPKTDHISITKPELGIMDV